MRPTFPKLRDDMNKLKLGEISLQEFGGPLNLLIRMPGQGTDPAIQKAAIDKVKAVIQQDDPDVDYRPGRVRRAAGWRGIKG